MRRVPLRFIPNGATVATHIFTPNGDILLRKGVSLSKSKVDRLKELGYNSIYINDEFSDNELEDVIDAEIRMDVVCELKESFKDFNTYVTKLDESAKASKWEMTKLRYGYLSGITDSATKIVEKLLNSKEQMISFQDVKNSSEYLYQHSVNVAVLAVVFGISVGYSSEKLEALAVGALLHDIGYNFISGDILSKAEKLTEIEYESVRKHAEIGYEHLKDNMDVSAHVRMIVYQHHEYLDGSGYPKGISGEDISELARIIAIIDIYDALTSDRPYRDALSPTEANEILLAHAIGQLDPLLVKKFVKLVVPFPIGTLVRLSNDEIGVVEDINPDFPLRPVVKVVIQKNIRTQIITRDLMSENNIIITGIQYEIPRIV